MNTLVSVPVRKRNLLGSGDLNSFYPVKKPRAEPDILKAQSKTFDLPSGSFKSNDFSNSFQHNKRQQSKEVDPKQLDYSDQNNAVIVDSTTEAQSPVYRTPVAIPGSRRFLTISRLIRKANGMQGDASSMQSNVFLDHAKTPDGVVYHYAPRDNHQEQIHKASNPFAKGADVDHLRDVNNKREDILDGVLLPLPKKIEALFEVFQALETVCLFHRSRRGLMQCTFEAVRSDVEALGKRAFTKHHLAQIMTIGKSLYSLSLVETDPNQPKKEYRLLIEPSHNAVSGPEPKDANLSVQKSEENNNPYRNEAVQSTKSLNYGVSSSIKGGEQILPNEKMNITYLMERRKNLFRDALRSYVMKYHIDFLKGLSEVVTVPESQVRVWHKDFDLESVPDIPPAALPQREKQKTFSYSDLEAKLSPFLVPSRMHLVRENSNDSVKSDSVQTPSNKQNDISNPSHGINNALLERLKTKEESKKRLAILGVDENVRRKQEISKLLSIMPAIRGFYVLEQKSSLPLAVVKTKLARSRVSGFSLDEMTNLLDKLIETATEWISRSMIGSVEFIKVQPIFYDCARKRLMDAMKELDSLIKASTEGNRECMPASLPDPSEKDTN